VVVTVVVLLNKTGAGSVALTKSNAVNAIDLDVTGFGTLTV